MSLKKRKKERKKICSQLVNLFYLLRKYLIDIVVLVIYFVGGQSLKGPLNYSWQLQFNSDL